MLGKSLRLLLLLTAGAPAMAQYSAPPPAPSDASVITPKNGQSPQQMWNDRYECYQWAVAQSGFDPNRSGAAAASASVRDQYSRAYAACIEGRGYTMRSAPPPPAPVLVPRGTVSYAQVLVPQAPTLKYQPVELQIDGGYSAPTGAAGDALDGGSNAGLGLTWFPTSALPIGLRVDGSYSWFGIKDSVLGSFGSGFTHGDENIYGGDADLQFDLAHKSSQYKIYVFGGAGRYREETDLRTVQLAAGIGCGFFYCGPGLFAQETARDRSTTPWLNSWNAGFGFETAVLDDVQFFVEARYLQIGPESKKQAFVPIRLGFRF
jgi:opacity protein-like surface antigen